MPETLNRNELKMYSIGALICTANLFSSGALLRIGDLLSRLLELAGAAGTPIVPDPALFRPTDAVPALSTERLRADTGWEPEIPIERTLRDLLAGV